MLSKSKTQLLIALLLITAILSGVNLVSNKNDTDTAPKAEAKEDEELASPPINFTKVVKKLEPGIVSIEVENSENSSELPDGHPPIPPKFRSSEGSGFIISKDGLILTNNHVISNAKEITVKTSDKKKYKAKIVGRDPAYDTALIKIKPKKKLKPLSLGDSKNIDTGEWVIAMGNPLGLENNVSIGIISAEKREFPDLPLVDFIQTDAGIYPGSSGGPLINGKGKVIGMNTAAIPDTQIGLSVPINVIKKLIPKLKKGDIERGSLGVYTIDPEEETGLSDLPKGAMIEMIALDSPAEEAGLQEGDIITGFNGTRIENPEDLARKEANSKPGEKVEITVDRDGKSAKIEATLGEDAGAVEE